MSKHLVLALLATGLLAVVGPTPAADEAPAKSKRTVYVVRHGAARDLADVLGKYFKGDAEVQILPDAPSNVLLISAPPGVFDEVVKVLDQLDRRPRPVAVDVFVANVTPRKGDSSADKELDERELTGPADQVPAKLEKLLKKGQFEGLKHLQLTVLENQSGSVTVGDIKPFVSGMTMTATGVSRASIQYHNVGTIVALTPHVTAEKTVLLELVVNDDHLAYAEDSPQLGTDENGRPVRAADFVVTNVNTKLDVPSGQAILAKDVKTTAKPGSPAQTLVVVTARVVDPEAEGKK